MYTKLTLTPEAQARVNALLDADACLGPVLPPSRLALLIDGHEARANGIVARAEASIKRLTTTIELRQAAVRRYGLLGAIIKRYYWKVSWDELAFRTERKFYLQRPAYWLTDSKEASK